MGKHKNILLLVADDLGKNISTYGGDCQTPYLDALAENGTRFDCAFTSTASCSGSRSVIYTGLHTHQNGTWGLANDNNHFMTFPHVETAPQLFNEIGYQTGVIGKIHVGPPNQYPWHIREESTTRDVAWVADRTDAFFERAQAADKPFFLTVGFIDPHRDGVSRGGFGNKDSGFDSRLQDRKYDPSHVSVPTFLTDLPEVRTELAEYYRAINRMDQGIGLILKALEKNGFKDDTLIIFLSDNGPPFINSKTTLYDAGVCLPLIMHYPGSKNTIRNPNMISYIDLLPTLLDWAGHSHLKGNRQGRSILPIINAESELPGWDRVFGSHTLHEITNYWPTRFLRTKQYKYHRNLSWQLQFPFATDLYMSMTWEGIRNSQPQTVIDMDGQPYVQPASLVIPSARHTTRNHSSTNVNGTQPSSAMTTDPLNGTDIMVGQRPFHQYLHRPPEELYDLHADPEEIHNLAYSSSPKIQAVLREMRETLEAWQADTGDRFLFRDSVSATQCKQYWDEGDAGKEGPTKMRLPDRFDLDARMPGNRLESGVEGISWAEDGRLRSGIYKQ